jgi:hypothetical protein
MMTSESMYILSRNQFLILVGITVAIGSIPLLHPHQYLELSVTLTLKYHDYSDLKIR